MVFSFGNIYSGQKLTKISHLEGFQRGEKLKSDFPIEGATFQKYYISIIINTFLHISNRLVVKKSTFSFGNIYMGQKLTKIAHLEGFQRAEKGITRFANRWRHLPKIL